MSKYLVPIKNITIALNKELNLIVSKIVWGTGTAKDLYSAYENYNGNNLDTINTVGAGFISVPRKDNILGQKAGAYWSTFNIFNSLKENQQIINIK